MFILILTKLWRQVFRKRQKLVLFLSTHTHPETKQTNKKIRMVWCDFAIQLKNKIILVTRCKNYDAIVVRGAHSHWRRIWLVSDNDWRDLHAPCTGKERYNNGPKFRYRNYFPKKSKKNSRWRPLWHLLGFWPVFC